MELIAISMLGAAVGVLGHLAVLICRRVFRFELI